MNVFVGVVGVRPCGVVDEMCSVDLSDASISANCPPGNWQNGDSSGDVASDWARVHAS